MTERPDLRHGDTVELAVGPSPSSVGQARDRLQAALHRWGCGNADDVTLVFSELATNAVRHARCAPTAVVTHEADEILLAIDDTSRDAPAIAAEAGAPGGYGLRIVDRVSERWGWEETRSGKTVWSVIRCRARR